MSPGWALLVTGMSIFLLNLPFGYWRAGTRRFSLAWILSIHIPVPVVVLLRLWAGLGWRLVYITPMVACFFAGQYVGGRFRQRRIAKELPVTQCLFTDLVRDWRGNVGHGGGVSS